MEEHLQHAFNHFPSIYEVLTHVVMDPACLSEEFVKLSKILPIISGPYFHVDYFVLNEALQHRLPFIPHSYDIVIGCK